MEVVMTTGAVKSSPPTNQHPAFLMPFMPPSQRCHNTQGKKYYIPLTCSSWGFPTLSLTNQGRAQGFALGARPKGRKSRPKTDSEGGVLGEGQQAPPHQLGSLGYGRHHHFECGAQNNAASEASRKIFGMYPTYDIFGVQRKIKKTKLTIFYLYCAQSCVIFNVTV